MNKVNPLLKVFIYYLFDEWSLDWFFINQILVRPVAQVVKKQAWSGQGSMGFSYLVSGSSGEATGL